MDTKKWMVKYNHKDGRNGKIKATTEIFKSGAFQYGNGKSGTLTIGAVTEDYDLRYNTEEDLHMAMLKEFFGKGLVSATEL